MAEQFNNESNNELDDFATTVTLTLDDGVEVECGLVSTFYAGDREYVALLPLEGEYAENGEVFIYRYSEDENGEPILDNIDSDEEYEIVADAFDELLDDEEFNELMGDDDDEE